MFINITLIDPLFSFQQYIGAVKQANHKPRFIISPEVLTFKNVEVPSENAKQKTLWALICRKFRAKKLTAGKYLKMLKLPLDFVFLALNG